MTSCQPFIDPPPTDCSDQQATLESNEFCGLLVNTAGSPFEECLGLSEISIMDLPNDCLFDVCSAMNDSAEARIVACETLAAVADQCAVMGLIIDWRSAANCCKSHLY